MAELSVIVLRNGAVIATVRRFTPAAIGGRAGRGRSVLPGVMGHPGRLGDGFCGDTAHRGRAGRPVRCHGVMVRAGGRDRGSVRG